MAIVTLRPSFMADDWDGSPPSDDHLPVYQRKVKELEWVWDRILPRGGTSLISGKPKVGKTTFLTHLVSAIAAGTQFIGRKTMQGRVLVLVCEGSEDEVIRKIQVATEMRPLPIYVKFARSSGPREGIKILRRVIEEYQPILLAVDTLWRLMWTEDVDEYAASVKNLEGMETIARDTGVHILSVAHEKKSSRGDIGDVLGSTALTAGVDTILQLKADGEARRISSTQRHGKNLDPTWISLYEGGYEIVERPPTPRVETKVQRVAEYIARNPGASNRDIARHCHVSKNMVPEYKKILGQ